MANPPSNFAFLAALDLPLAEYGATAESLVHHKDAATAAFAVRNFAEALAHTAANLMNLETVFQESFSDLSVRLQDRRVIEQQQKDWLDRIRLLGNRGHPERRQRPTPKEAGQRLRDAWNLAVWFHRRFRDAQFCAGQFLDPADPKRAEAERRLTERAQAAENARLQRANDEHAEETRREKQLRADAEAKLTGHTADVSTAIDLAAEAQAIGVRNEGQLAEIKTTLREVQDALQAVATSAAAVPKQVAPTLVPRTAALRHAVEPGLQRLEGVASPHSQNSDESKLARLEQVASDVNLERLRAAYGSGYVPRLDGGEMPPGTSLYHTRHKTWIRAYPLIGENAPQNLRDPLEVHLKPEAEGEERRLRAIHSKRVVDGLFDALDRIRVSDGLRADGPLRGASYRTRRG